VLTLREVDLLMLEEEPVLREEEVEGEPASPPLDLEGNERAVSRLTDSRTRDGAADPDPPERDTAPLSRDGDEITRPEDAPDSRGVGATRSRERPDEAPAFPSREGKLRILDALESPPAGGR